MYVWVQQQIHWITRAIIQQNISAAVTDTTDITDITDATDASDAAGL